MTQGDALSGVLRRAVLALGIVVAVIVGMSGCSLLGEALGQKTTTAEENHEFQRETAQKFRVVWPAIQSIRYTQEGSYSGSGNWAANATVTIANKEYQEIIGPDTRAGDDIPDPGAFPPAEALTVYYSDGTSEVL